MDAQSPLSGLSDGPELLVRAASPDVSRFNQVPSMLELSGKAGAAAAIGGHTIMTKGQPGKIIISAHRVWPCC